MLAEIPSGMRPFASFFFDSGVVKVDVLQHCDHIYSDKSLCIWCKQSRPSFTIFFHDDDSPFMNELLQSSTFRHQLRTLAPQSHEGQDGQQVICTAVRQKREEGGETEENTSE